MSCCQVARTILFQSVMNREVCIRKELYAECRVVGGMAVFRGLVGRMTRTVRLDGGSVRS